MRSKVPGAIVKGFRPSGLLRGRADMRYGPSREVLSVRRSSTSSMGSAENRRFKNRKLG